MSEYVWQKNELNIDKSYRPDFSREYNHEVNIDNSKSYEWEYSDDDNTQDVNNQVFKYVDSDFNPVINVDFENGPSDVDNIDLDLSDHASVGDMLIAKGDINFDPGDDINVEDVLNDALNGAGNDTGFVLNNSNMLEDNDQATDTYVANQASFAQNLTATGGSAVADDGLAFGGSSMTVDALDDATVIGEVMAAANAANSTEAFVNELVQGANILNNSVDTSIVGGDLYTDSVGEDDL
ncbi:fibrinogen binding protein [Stappia aggregata IAM 12614]|uniref:Fibrinogen binding protein n=1 Tax=Roseibium aggregatum (strain ATCC 25650 / DSM 13394 / JCM 20685 / NBRC 16684 / NCIMB 2208 / IAM 12614 / B1) TaxID=384765 RepID=A0NXN4_ROSAI|nr:hypothetical protein [Roseibium aggregatum]EAV42561.1 fibrinogen binding protein [Stappia aggregata IAM 12614] [Roseibium aggregatum IAM 12614]